MTGQLQLLIRTPVGAVLLGFQLLLTNAAHGKELGHRWRLGGVASLH